MIDPSRSVAIVGRPNVGKSRIFNRLVGKRVSIVHDQPGVTRDIVMEVVDDNFIVMDTGGIGMKATEMSPGEINKATELQVEFAIQAAAVVLFVVDAQTGLTPQDEVIATELRKYGRKTVLVINKADSPSQLKTLDDFHCLGFDPEIAVSAEHGLNFENIVKEIEKILGPKPEVVEDEGVVRQRARICFVGRPNVGKSSLTNSLLKEERMIVSDIPGTTRDAIRVNLDYKAPDETVWEFELVDTAGLRPKAKVGSSVEFFSGLRTEEAMLDTDVVFLLLDAMEGVTKMDRKIAGDVLESGRALVIVVNKWDFALKKFSQEPLEGYENEGEFRLAFTKSIRKELFFLPDSPIVFVSAKEGYGVKEVLRRGKALYERMKKKISTGKLNEVIGDLLERQPPHVVSGRRFKIYYAVQVGYYPFRFRLFCNHALRLEDSYKRYLEHGFIEAFQLRGCPVKFELVGKPPRAREGYGQRAARPLQYPRQDRGSC